MRSLSLRNRADVIEVFGSYLGTNQLSKRGIQGKTLTYTSRELMEFLDEGHNGERMVVKCDPRDVSYAIAYHPGTKRRFVVELAADEAKRAFYSGRPRCWLKTVREIAARKKRTGGSIRTEDLRQANADLSAEMDARTGARERGAAQTRMARHVKRDLARKPVGRHREEDDDLFEDLFEHSRVQREEALRQERAIDDIVEAESRTEPQPSRPVAGPGGRPFKKRFVNSERQEGGE